MGITKKAWAGIAGLLCFGGWCIYMIVNADTIFAYISERPEYILDQFVPYAGLMAMIMGLVVIIRPYILGGKG